MAAELDEAVPNLEGTNWYEAYNTICEYYRLSLLNALYCGKRLASMRAANLALEVSLAVLTAVVAGLTAVEAPIVSTLWITTLAIVAACLAALKPVLKLSDRMGDYSTQHGGYRDLQLGYHDLVTLIRVEKRVTPSAWREHEALRKRYRALAVSSDPNPSKRFRASLQAEVDQQIPQESLRIST